LDAGQKIAQNIKQLLNNYQSIINYQTKISQLLIIPPFKTNMFTRYPIQYIFLGAKDIFLL